MTQYTYADVMGTPMPTVTAATTGETMTESDDQVPLMVGDVFAFVMVVDHFPNMHI